jgi:hypothetical protein
VGDAALFAEEAIVARAVDKHRREFATGRDCAHTAMRKLGLGPRSVLAGECGEPLSHRQPRWLGSASTQSLTCGCHAACFRQWLARELPMLSQLGRAVPGVWWDRLLFNANESIYIQDLVSARPLLAGGSATSSCASSSTAPPRIRQRAATYRSILGPGWRRAQRSLISSALTLGVRHRRVRSGPSAAAPSASVVSCPPVPLRLRASSAGRDATR